MSIFFMLEPTESSQSINQVVWWLEVAKIVLPILTTIATTIAVGYWINRSSERYKNDLAKEIHRYQTLYPRRLKLLEELLALIRDIAKDVTRALRMVNDEEFYLGNDEHLDQDLRPLSGKLWTSLENLKGKFDEGRVLLEADARNRIEALTNDLEAARYMVVRIHVEETDESYVEAQTPEGREKAEKLIKGNIPKQIEELEQMVRSSIGV